MPVPERVEETLKHIIVHYGRTVCNEPRRLEALLKDLRMGEDKREVNLLLTALRAGVPGDLMNTSLSNPAHFVYYRLVSRLSEEHAISDDAAHWAVQTWAEALGVEVPQPAPPPVAETVVAPVSPVAPTLVRVVPPPVTPVAFAPAPTPPVSPAPAPAPAPNVVIVPPPALAPQVLSQPDPQDAEGQYRLALRYYNGQGITKDLAQAAVWCRKAANQGHADAQYELGNLYYNGEGVTKNPAQTAQWYRKAAIQGHAAAQNGLGDCYNYGRGIDMDRPKAVEWYRKAAAQGHSIAQYNIGYCYQYGRGVGKDTTEATRWFRKAADQGYTGAQESVLRVSRNSNRIATQALPPASTPAKSPVSTTSTAGGFDCCSTCGCVLPTLVVGVLGLAMNSSVFEGPILPLLMGVLLALYALMKWATRNE